MLIFICQKDDTEVDVLAAAPDMELRCLPARDRASVDRNGDQFHGDPDSRHMLPGTALK